MEKVLQIIKNIKEKYSIRSNRNKAILVGILFVSAIMIAVLYSSLTTSFDVSENKKKNSANLSEIIKQSLDEKQAQPKNNNLSSGDRGESVVPFSKENSNPDSFSSSTQNVNDQSVNQITSGPLDDYIIQLKEEYKNSDQFPVIFGFLESVKEIADGKRVWNGLTSMSAQQYFGAKKAQEIENKIEKAKGFKAQKIRNFHFDNLDELVLAVRRDTQGYTERAAIEGFLSRVEEAARDQAPWNENVKNLGEINLDKAWVDQIDQKIRAIKNQEAIKFNSTSYNNIDDLIKAIKDDTKDYLQQAARDNFLNRVREIALAKNSYSEEEINAGEYYLEDYHVEAIKKFLRR